MENNRPILPVGRRRFLLTLAAAGSSLSLARARPAPRPAQLSSLPAGSRPGDWPLTGCDLRGTNCNTRETLIGPGNVGRLKVKWTFDGAGDFNQTTPIVVGDTVYFPSHDGHVYAVNAADGQLRWKFHAWEGIEPDPPGRRREDINIDPVGEMRGGPGFGDGRIFVGTGSGKVHALDAASGRELWQTLIDPRSGYNRTRVNSDAVFFDGKVVVGTSTSVGKAQTVCLDAETGAIRWAFDTVPDPKAVGGGAIWSAASIDVEQKIVYNATGSLKGHVPGPMLYSESMIANDLESGELLWYNQLRSNDPFDLDFSCHPILFEATHPIHTSSVRECVGAGSKTGFHTYDRHTGEHLWTASVTNGGPTLSSTAFVDDKICMVSNAASNHSLIAQSATVALHAYTGEVLWWHPNKAATQGPAAAANGLFYQGFNDGLLEALDVETGRPMWSFELPSPRRGGIVISNGTLYTTCGVAKTPPFSLYAFSLDGV